MEITSVEFGILSPEEILNNSVCEIKFDKKKLTDENSLYDPRMGPTDDEKECITCKKSQIDCPGHFGHIVLNAHIIYPLLYGFKTVVNILKCFCFKCSKGLITKQKLEFLGLSNLKNRKRYLAIINIIEDIEVCWSCGSQVAKFFIANLNTDPKISMFYKLLSEKKSKETSIEVSVAEIERVFSIISNEDLEIIGLNPERFHPKNLIISVLPVMPPCSRPPVFTGTDKCDDDLTTIYRDITKTNDKILTLTNEEEKLKEIRSLSFYISVLMDNSKGRVKQPNGRAKKGIKDRLATKKGLFRSQLCGRRTNYSARTVVGGDPTLDADQLAIPDCIAKNVTIPNIVTEFSMKKLSLLVNSGEAQFVYRTDVDGTRRKINLNIATKTKGTQLYYGDKIYREETKGDVACDIKPALACEKEIYIPEVSLLQEGDKIVRRTGETIFADISKPRYFKLQLGDEVHRHLQNNDWVCINRQPTLHVGSMLGCRVKRFKGRRSIGTPLNLTTPLNMDYDGKTALGFRLVAINSGTPQKLFETLLWENVVTQIAI